jgi:hypothetical protein
MNLKKQSLEIIYKFLDGVKLVGAASRARTKFNQALAKHLDDLQQDEQTLVLENNGVIKEGGSVTFNEIEDKKTFLAAQRELRQEAVILMETTQDQFKRLKNALENYDQALDGANAEAYDTLLDALEAEGEEL